MNARSMTSMAARVPEPQARINRSLESRLVLASDQTSGFELADSLPEAAMDDHFPGDQEREPDQEAAMDFEVIEERDSSIRERHPRDHREHEKREPSDRNGRDHPTMHEGDGRSQDPATR